MNTSHQRKRCSRAGYSVSTTLISLVAKSRTNNMSSGEYRYGLQKYNIKENHNSTRDLAHELYQQDFCYVSIAFTCRTSMLHTLRMPVLIIFVQYAIFASLLASNPEAKSVVPELTTRDNPWWRHQKEKNFPRYWPFVRGIDRSPMNSPHKGQWCGAFFDLHLNKRPSKLSWSWWFETQSCPLWRHC